MTAQQILLQKYGDPGAPDYQSKWCILWEVQQDFAWFPVKHFEVNKDFKDILFKAFTALEAAGLHTEIKTFDGCLNYRPVRDKNVLSLHAWGCALDINAAENPLIRNPTPEQRANADHWTPAFVSTMETAGLYWGGEFVHSCDSMHWAEYNG